MVGGRGTGEDNREEQREGRKIGRKRKTEWEGRDEGTEGDLLKGSLRRRRR